MIPIDERSGRKIGKLSKEVVLRAARILNLDNGGMNTGVTSLRSELKSHFAQAEGTTEVSNSYCDESSSYGGFDDCFPVYPRFGAASSKTTIPPPPPPPPPPPNEQSSHWTEHSNAQGKSFWYNSKTSESTWNFPDFNSALQKRPHSDIGRFKTDQDAPTKREREHTNQKMEHHHGKPGNSASQGARSERADGGAEAREARERAEAREARERAHAEAREARERAEAREARERAERSRGGFYKATSSDESWR